VNGEYAPRRWDSQHICQARRAPATLPGCATARRARGPAACPREGSADGPGDVARFAAPMGIAGDGAGTLYVADAYNATIRVIRCP